MDKNTITCIGVISGAETWNPYNPCQKADIKPTVGIVSINNNTDLLTVTYPMLTGVNIVHCKQTRYLNALHHLRIRPATDSEIMQWRKASGSCRVRRRFANSDERVMNLPMMGTIEKSDIITELNEN